MMAVYAARQLSLVLCSYNGLQTRHHERITDMLNACFHRPRLLLYEWRSSIGDLRLGKTDKGVALLEFVKPGESAAPSARLQKTFMLEDGKLEIAVLTHVLEEYLSGERNNLAWIVDDVLMCSDFQRQVLEITTQVPYGTVMTYQAIAERLGRPKAIRAVGRAIGRNPVAIHIPCHRIVGSNGSLTGYAGSVAVKRQILATEGIPIVETRCGAFVVKNQCYIGWHRQGWFCTQQCVSVGKKPPAGESLLIASRARAQEMGYRPCQECRPDVAPPT
jgi:methylated-DNA-[protein]-cysteine S-methyltransferase